MTRGLTEQEDDYSRGLDGWSVFTAFGEPVRYWRNRKQGEQLVGHPTREKGKCLHVRRGPTRIRPTGPSGVSPPAEEAVWR